MTTDSLGKLRSLHDRVVKAIGDEDLDAILACMSRYGRARMMVRLHGPAAIAYGVGTVLPEIASCSWQTRPAARSGWYKVDLVLRNLHGEPIHATGFRIRETPRNFLVEDFGPSPWQPDPDEPGGVRVGGRARTGDSFVCVSTWEAFESRSAVLPCLDSSALDEVASGVVASAELLGMSVRQVAGAVCLWEDYVRRVKVPAGRVKGWIGCLLYTTARLEALDMSQGDAGEASGVSVATVASRFKELCHALKLEHYDLRYSTLDMVSLDMMAMVPNFSRPRRSLLSEPF